MPEPIAARPLSVEEAVALREATDPRVSPDGSLVAFCVGAVSKEGEHAEGTIHLVPCDGSAPARPFTSGPGLDAAPRWSPDGRHLAFVSDRHERGKPAVYTIPLGGGEAVRLVSERGEASDPRWSPDGTCITFLLKEIDSEDEEKRKKEQRDDAIVVDDDKYTRLWLVDVATRATVCLSPPGLQIWQQAWAPDGAGLAVVHTPTPKVNDAYAHNAIGYIPVRKEGDTTWAAGEMRQICRVQGDMAALSWSPDGTRLAFTAREIQKPATLGADVPLVVAAEGGEPRPVLSGHPAQLSWADWLSDDELVAAGVEDMYGVYYRVPVDGGEPVRLFDCGRLGQGSPRQLSLSAGRSVLAYTREDMTSPGDVWAVRYGGEPIRLTTLNPESAERTWGEVEAVSWQSSDGLEVRGLLVKPVGYQPGRRYPTVVHVHGGPAWLWGDRFYAGWHDWDQFLAARGYAVLLPNPRGSTGRGTAYMAAVYDDVGGGEWQDVLSGARWAVESGIADPERLGLGGWSWGGYLTAWGITQTDLFKAAVMGAGVSNLWSDQGQNDIPDMNLLYFPELPYGDARPYIERSPMAHVTRASTPTLILHGEKDERVAPPQAQEFYRALKTLGVPAQMVLYPRETHSISERRHQIDLLNRVLAWFDRYLKG